MYLAALKRAQKSTIKRSIYPETNILSVETLKIPFLSWYYVIKVSTSLSRFLVINPRKSIETLINRSFLGLQQIIFDYKPQLSFEIDEQSFL